MLAILCLLSCEDEILSRLELTEILIFFAGQTYVNSQKCLIFVKEEQASIKATLLALAAKRARARLATRFTSSVGRALDF